MNVGILTLGRVRNWGSFLQAFALKKTVEDFGHGCVFLEIDPRVRVPPEPAPEPGRGVPSVLGKIARSPKTLWHTAKEHARRYSPEGRYQRRFRERYDREFLPLLGIPAGRDELEQTFDLVIIGSDQVFNCLHPTVPWGRTMHLFGEGIRAKRIVTYAASFGFTTSEGLAKEGLKQRIAAALKNVSSISVRDLNSHSIIAEITGTPPLIHVDPVLMFDFGPFVPRVVPERDYIIIYSYQQDAFDRETVDAIRRYAKGAGKRIVSLYSYHDWCDQCIVADTPFELLAYFAGAHGVITNTFHGTVFSLKYNRNFVVQLKERNRNRVDFLLGQFNLQGRIVSGSEEIGRKLEEGIDYTEFNGILAREQASAREYLAEALRS